MTSQPESRLSRDIMNLIRARGGFCFKVHGGPTTMAGVPDICGVFRTFSIWIETKMPDGGDPSPIQRVRHQEIEASGGAVLVARSVNEVDAWLDGLTMSIATAFNTMRPVPPNHRN